LFVPKIFRERRRELMRWKEKKRVFREEELRNKIFCLEKQMRVLQNAKNILEEELRELRRREVEDSLIPNELILSLH